MHAPLLARPLDDEYLQGKEKPGDDLLSHHEGSTIGVRELNFRVRNGNGWFLSAIATGIIISKNYQLHIVNDVLPAVFR